MWKAFVECCMGSPKKSQQPIATVRANGNANPPRRGISTSTAPKPDTRESSEETPVIEKPKRKKLVDKSVSSLAESSETSSSSSSPVAAGSTSDEVPISELPCQGKNYLFYQNRIPSKPNPGGTIDQIHAAWFGNYSLLEFHHGYIQWLFPVFESAGMSFHSDRLEKEEANHMRADLKSSIRLVKSYKLMLDFYGMQLLNYETGEIGRHPKNWKSRYENLNTQGHNYLRISRMLMSLGELGFVRYKSPWMDFMQQELETHTRLNNARRSYANFWRPLCDPNSPGYRQKTKETKEDRAESVFFQVMAAGGEEWEAIQAELDAYPGE